MRTKILTGKFIIAPMWIRICYLHRDIRDLAQVADEMQLYSFMTAAAAHTAKPVIYEELAGEAGISAPTAKKWLSVLVSSHIISLHSPLSG